MPPNRYTGEWAMDENGMVSATLNKKTKEYEPVWIEEVDDITGQPLKKENPEWSRYNLAKKDHEQAEREVASATKKLGSVEDEDSLLGKLPERRIAYQHFMDTQKKFDPDVMMEDLMFTFDDTGSVVQYDTQGEKGSNQSKSTAGTSQKLLVY